MGAHREGPGCPACRSSVAAGDRFCATCGAGLDADRTASRESPAPGPSHRRRRLGGSSYLADTTGPPVDPGRASDIPRRRRQRRVPWFRRPLLVAPLLLAVVLVSLGAAAAWRATGVVSSLHRVGTPPEEVSLTVDEADLADEAAGDPTVGAVTVDTAPARRAVAEAELDLGGAGGVEGRVRALGDLGMGAADAAGLGDGPPPAMTVLVMGVDARPGEQIDVGVRPDVLMLVRLDPAAGSCRVLSIPRDTRTELPGYGLSKVNHALALGGIPYQLLVVQALMGVDIDHYALINFEGFKALVDAVGGITVQVPDGVMVGGLTIEEGPQEFDGTRALAYARHRDMETDGDIGRVQRQLAVLRGLGAAAAERDLATDVGAVLPAVEENIRTDMGTSEMAAIGRTYGSSCTVDTASAEVLAGRRQRMTDPIFDLRLYYNVVDAALIAERRAFLLGA